MAYNTFGQFRPSGRMDRGTRRGAQRMIVTPDMQLLDHALAKTAGIEGIYFQSKAEAIRWIALNTLLKAGHVRNLRRQIKYPLHVVNPAGLKVKLGTWAADFVFEERHAVGPNDPAMWIGESSAIPTAGRLPYEWIEVIEDVKGHPEDVYLWKRTHFEAEYGKTITESRAWARR